MSNIKNIIFDLGGVLLNIDYNKVVTAFEELGFGHFENWYSQKDQNELFNLLETGKISDQQFIEELKKHVNDGITEEQIESAWNSMLLDLPKARVELLQSLKGRYRCFLLSNTNEVHVRHFTNKIAQKYGIGTFESLFEKIYYSNCMDMRKPNTEIFDFVLKENNLNAAETLFIDDSIQHVEGARKAGLSAIHLSKEKSILDLFDATPHLIS
jgi:HAD superfamily hydrolase (TIGR01509 family)